RQWKALLDWEVTDPMTTRKTYMWGAMHRDELIFRDRDVSDSLDERLYVTHDYFSPTAITDATGAVQERYAYSAYGVRRIMDTAFVTISASEFDCDFGFQGQMRDAESGFYNYGYRYYSPEVGRWLNRDPIKERGGNYLYAMVQNQQINTVDRLGLARSVRILRGKATLEDNKIGYDITLEHSIPVGTDSVQVVTVTTKTKGGGGENRSQWTFVDVFGADMSRADNWLLKDTFNFPLFEGFTDQGSGPQGQHICEIVQTNESRIGTSSWERIEEPARMAGLAVPGYSTGTPLSPTGIPDVFVLDPETEAGARAIDRISATLIDSISFSLKVTWSATGNGGNPKETYETTGALPR
ncbi:MAG: RHS repeat-associated core domain-containing protein, partial [Nitrospirales bacterium]